MALPQLQQPEDSGDDGKPPDEDGEKARPGVCQVATVEAESREQVQQAADDQTDRYDRPTPRPGSVRCCDTPIRGVTVVWKVLR